MTADLVAVARRLRLESAATALFSCFEEAGVRSLLLKGPALTQWLYGDDPRPYLDCDVLVAPEDIASAEQILSSVGYRATYRTMPASSPGHAENWLRPIDGVTVDLHRTLLGARAADETVWSVLWTDHDFIELRGRRIPAPSLPARALHVALHAAQHGTANAVTLEDLRRALALGDDDLWRSAARLADQVEAMTMFLAGLRLLTEGEDLIRRLDLPSLYSAEAILRATSAPPLALAFEQLASAESPSVRLALLARKVFPPPGFMNYWDPQASESHAALLRAYRRRFSWLMGRAPTGLRAWRRARRRARQSRFKPQA